MRRLIFCCIPARGGSSLIGKNLRTLWGKPLLYWSVQAALGSRADLVCVSTDCPEIGAYATSLGVTVVKRPSNISGPKSSSEEAVNHAIDFLDIDPYQTLLVQATTPSVTSEDLDGMIAKLENFDSVFLAWPTSALIWGKGEWNPAGTCWYGLNHDYQRRPMRQDRMQLEEAGCYAWRGISPHRFFGRIAPYETRIGIDINDRRDFELATLSPPDTGHG